MESDPTHPLIHAINAHPDGPTASGPTGCETTKVSTLLRSPLRTTVPITCSGEGFNGHIDCAPEVGCLPA